VPPKTNYYDVPLSRRAAVLLLLYADQNGDLRAVLTIRAKTLSSCEFEICVSSPLFRDLVFVDFNHGYLGLISMTQRNALGLMLSHKPQRLLGLR
jgi:hypothetical protein